MPKTVRMMKTKIGSNALNAVMTSIAPAQSALTIMQMATMARRL